MSGYSRSIACILRSNTESVEAAGAGIVLDKRRVLTCAHVVNEALGRPVYAADPPTSAVITVTVPLRRGGAERFVATVVPERWRAPTDQLEFDEPEDIAVLELGGGTTFPCNVSASCLIELDLSDEHDRPVRLTGFPGGGSDDRIRGAVNGVNVEGRVRIDPVSESRVVAGGFSGAGIWDERCAGVVGMLVAKRTRGDATIAYGLPVEVIARALGLPLTSPDQKTIRRLPPLPRHLVAREAFLRPLRNQVLAERSVGVAAQSATALKGMGGLGKTVLATALVYDPDVAAQFGPRRHWITMGQRRRATAAQAELLRDLTGERADVETTTDGLKQLREALADRPCLIVIDDVWTADQAAAFEGLGETATLVVTTRQAAVIQRLGAQPFPLDILDPEQSRELLAGWAGVDVNALPDCADAVIKECGRLPLALATFGAAVAQSGMVWEDGLEALHARELQDLARPIDGYHGNEGVFGAIRLSFSVLSLADQEAFARCGVFPEDRPIPGSALAALWSDLPTIGDSDRAQRRLCQRLEEASLWRRDTGTDDKATYRIHDLVSDYLHARLKAPAVAHRALVEGYRRECPDGWASWLDDDGYFLDWLPTHLAKAGLVDELQSLQFDLAWLRRKLAARGANALITDTRLCAHDGELQLLGRVIRMSVHMLNREPRQLEAQLLGRLQEENGHRTATLMSQAAKEIDVSVLVPHGGRHLMPPGPLRRTLEGHRFDVRGVLLLPDGRALSWSGDHSLRLWDLSTGDSRPLEGHSAFVEGALLLSDGRALSWSYDETLRLWDLETGDSRALRGHGEFVGGALPLRDDRALSWSYDKTLRLWNLETGDSCALEGHGGPVRGALLLSDGRALSWSYDETLRLWDLETGDSCALEGHSGAVRGALLLPDGRALSWSGDKTLRLWDLEVGHSCALEGHNNWVGGALLLPDDRALSWSYDRTLRLWDLETGDSCALEGHGGPVRGALLLPDGRTLSWSDDASLRLWDLETGHSRDLEGHDGPVRGALLLSDGRALSWSDDASLRLWDLETGHSRALEGHSYRVAGGLLLPGGDALSWSSDGTLRLWDLGTSMGSDFQEQRHGGPVRGALLLSDGRALSWSNDGTLRLWDLEVGDSRAFEGHGAFVEDALLLPDGRALSWSADSTLRLWDLEVGDSRAFEGHDDWVRGAMLLPDDRALSWSEDGTLRLWDLETRKGRDLLGHRGPVRGALLLPDGRALSWSNDGTLRLWDLETEKADVLEGSRNKWILGALLLPDGRALSWSEDSTLRLWDLETGDSCAFKGHGGTVMGALPLPGGRALSWSTRCNPAAVGPGDRR